jgi:FKBP-type peptidyl-prolyl cis-trans isomerase
MFQIGKGVITGWSLGLPTMKLGEKAEFTMAPQYAYGVEGRPPHIPPNSTLIFDIELLRISK